MANSKINEHEEILVKVDQNNLIYEQMNAILETAAIIIKPHAKSYSESKYGFEVFGCDFMITNDLVVKLIEINARHDYGVDDLKKENAEGFKIFYDYGHYTMEGAKYLGKKIYETNWLKIN